MSKQDSVTSVAFTETSLRGKVMSVQVTQRVRERKMKKEKRERDRDARES